MFLYACLLTFGIGIVVGLLGIALVHFRPKKRDTIEGKHILVSTTRIFCYVLGSMNNILVRAHRIFAGSKVNI